MNCRILPPDEWHKLAGTDLELVTEHANQDGLAVIVVEDGEKIVARWCVFQATHFEGIWIDPEYRGRLGVVRPLLRQAFAFPQMRGEQWVFSGAERTADGVDEKVAGLLERLGGKPVPVQFYALPVGGR